MPAAFLVPARHLLDQGYVVGAEIGEDVVHPEIDQAFEEMMRGRVAAHALLPGAVGNEFIAQGADAGDLDLDDVTGLQVRRGAVGAHPDHVARPQREIFRQFHDEGLDAEDHVVGAEAIAFLAVHLHDGFHPVEIDIGLDPGAHRLEGVGVLGPPQPAIGLLPATLADIVADGVAEYAGHRVSLVEVLCLLADHDHQLALIVDLLGGDSPGSPRLRHARSARFARDSRSRGDRGRSAPRRACRRLP